MATPNTPASIAALRIPRIEHNKDKFDEAITDLKDLKNIDYSPSFTTEAEAETFHANLGSIPYITVTKQPVITERNRWRIRGISYKISVEPKTINPDLDAKRIKTMYMRIYEKNEDKYDGISKFELFEKFLRLVAKFRQMRGDAADQTAGAAGKDDNQDADQADDQDDSFSANEYEDGFLSTWDTHLQILIQLYRDMNDGQRESIADELKPFFNMKVKDTKKTDLDALANDMTGLSAGASKSDGGGAAAVEYVDLRF